MKIKETEKTVNCQLSKYEVHYRLLKSGNHIETFDTKEQAEKYKEFLIEANYEICSIRIVKINK